MKRRLGLPAMGLATPLGVGKPAVAANLFAGTRAGLAHQVKILPDRLIHVGWVEAALPATSRPHASRNSRLMLLALQEIRAEIDAARDLYGAGRIAVILGTSTSGIAEGEAAFALQLRDGAWPQGFDYWQQELGSFAAFIAAELQLSGPAYTIATACSSSAKVFASARRLIASGICDAAIVGGADTLCGTTSNGFASLDAVSRGLCQPFSRNRDGINIGEGAAAFLLTREGTEISLLGFGESSDAHHLSAPDPSGAGAQAAMSLALRDAGLAPGDISYVNLHGTATPLNDAMEGIAVHNLFGACMPCSSTKAMTGHMLGAAGACEAAFLWLTLHPDYGRGRLPPHLWDGVPDPAIPPLNFVAAGAELDPSTSRAMLSNSFAFGGSNIAVILGRGAC
ncbi:beta-ketoacyl-[acyl-carrier-protein] synthase family protein [Dongia sp.]|uniref:beta-ketoacyl-[acyl-carrier-protein] synthase family protein n=1 Tax=Dongia sp. TaxID=1977262 RepID=UPI0035B13C6F